MNEWVNIIGSICPFCSTTSTLLDCYCVRSVLNQCIGLTVSRTRENINNIINVTVMNGLNEACDLMFKYGHCFYRIYVTVYKIVL